MRLRPYADADLGLTRRLESDPGVVGHLGGAGDEEHAAQVHQRRLAGVADGDLYYVIEPEDAGPVGLIAIWRSEFEGRAVHELGAMLLPDFQARGVAGAAFDRLLPLAVARGVRVLHAFPAVGNGPSNAILHKLGFTRGVDCDLDYEGRPLRCAHWQRDLAAPAP
ncbi:GNAT family N-acetyltransferase [Pseudosporangium ferrugineum]|uniref:L-amino acid N-acyltransferase YncA n=1 Tax=Pseudosporangium ferrugineum TaxID=439699 RepID=A0A2T0SDX9_9ACTN|nr:GNAT family N-acetyltransferase [Pseudosporangium ferrugineum]PRY31591.1 L-amino acid N-acyltransferase YncA [Pseudosporangium ferrugineum]